MVKSTTAEIQSALDHFLAGDQAAKAELVNRAGDRLMILARKLLRGFGSGPDETAAVVSEAYLKLHKALDEVRPTTVRQFFGLASLQMRRVLLDLVRATKRGGRVVHEGSGQFETPDSADGPSQSDLVTDLYTAIDTLDDDLKEVVMLLYFQGLTQAEAGELLGVHEDTVKRRWAKARVILAGKLAAFDPAGD
ncbi:MAG: sigma-70 family RNA polymerase sigma factor [Gemmataceae bacterium]|nr:sigma-70 family RNA polymerase sigma factor [Gemmataceae bacterium]